MDNKATGKEPEKQGMEMSSGGPGSLTRISTEASLTILHTTRPLFFQLSLVRQEILSWFHLFCTASLLTTKRALLNPVPSKDLKYQLC